jgi:hypothetical protein
VRGKLRSFHDDELRGFARHLVPRGYWNPDYSQILKGSDDGV